MNVSQTVLSDWHHTITLKQYDLYNYYDLVSVIILLFCFILPDTTLLISIKLNMSFYFFH